MWQYGGRGIRENITISYSVSNRPSILVCVHKQNNNHHYHLTWASFVVSPHVVGVIFPLILGTWLLAWQTVIDIPSVILKKSFLNLSKNQYYHQWMK